MKPTSITENVKLIVKNKTRVIYRSQPDDEITAVAEKASHHNYFKTFQHSKRCHQRNKKQPKEIYKNEKKLQK